MGKSLSTKPIRVGAVIETAHGEEGGVLLVRDAKDRYRREVLTTIAAKQAGASQKGDTNMAKRQYYATGLVHQGRFSLPGGKIDAQDYEQAGATHIMDKTITSLDEEDIGLFRQVVRLAIAREVKEELGLDTDMASMLELMEIQGRARHHLIYLVQAVTREVIINADELQGIGFLGVHNAIPLNKYFYQHHLRVLYERYIKSINRPHRVRQYLSALTLPVNLMEGWVQLQRLGHEYRRLGKNGNYDIREPAMPSSTPNFTIIDSDGQPLARMPSSTPAAATCSLTRTATARIIPAPPRLPEDLGVSTPSSSAPRYSNTTARPPLARTSVTTTTSPVPARRRK